MSDPMALEDGPARLSSRWKVVLGSCVIELCGGVDMFRLGIIALKTCEDLV